MAKENKKGKGGGKGAGKGAGKGSGGKKWWCSCWKSDDHPSSHRATLATLPNSVGGMTAIAEERALAVPPNRVPSGRTPHGTLVAPALGHSTHSCRMAAADAERLDRRTGPGGQRAPDRRLPAAQSCAVPSPEQPRPLLPRRARPHARQVTIVCSWRHTSRCTPGYPHPATLARRAVRAAAEASRLIMVRQPCPGGSPSPMICEARQIERDSPHVRQAALQAALVGAPQAALAGASSPRLAGSQGLLAGMRTHEQRNPASGPCVRGVGLLCAAARQRGRPAGLRPRALGTAPGLQCGHLP